MLFDKIKFVAMVVGFLCLAYLAAVGAVTVVTGAPPAWAGPLGASPIGPVKISYQGTLRDTNDDPVSGTYEMVVGIYDASAGGKLLWDETHTGVEVREGHFSLLLGETDKFDWADFNSPNRYIGLEVGGVEMTPRQSFTTVPYAIFAKALSAPDGNPMTAVTVDNDGNVGIGTETVNRPLSIGDDRTAGTPGWISLNDPDGNTEWAITSAGGAGLQFWESYPKPGGSRLFLKDQGNVGIGTSNPQARLDVNGSAQVRGDASVTGRVGIGTETLDNRPLTIQGSGENSEWISFKDTNGETQWNLNYRGTGLNFGETGQASRLFLEDGGRVGIGTREPQAKLDVNGDIDWSGDLKGFGITGTYTVECNARSDAPDQCRNTRRAKDMMHYSKGICFLTMVQFTDCEDPPSGEWCKCEIELPADNVWEVVASTIGGDSYAQCRARCLTW